MFVVFILYFDVIVFAYCPVEICCSFIVSLCVLCLGKFRASGNKVINCFLKWPTNFIIIIIIIIIIVIIIIIIIIITIIIIIIIIIISF